MLLNILQKQTKPHKKSVTIQQGPLNRFNIKNNMENNQYSLRSKKDIGTNLKTVLTSLINTLCMLAASLILGVQK